MVKHRNQLEDDRRPPIESAVHLKGVDVVPARPRPETQVVDTQRAEERASPRGTCRAADAVRERAERGELYAGRPSRPRRDGHVARAGPEDLQLGALLPG